MKEKNPLDPLITQISDIIQFIHDNEKKPLSPEVEKDLIEKLEMIENQYAIYKELSERAFELAGGNDKPAVNKEIDPKQKQSLERIGAMQKDLNRLQVGLKRALTKFELENLSPEKKNKNAAKAHKKKYKRMEKNEKWMRL